jgi:hypothetical protein
MKVDSTWNKSGMRDVFLNMSDVHMWVSSGPGGRVWTHYRNLFKFLHKLGVEVKKYE